MNPRLAVALCLAALIGAAFTAGCGGDDDAGGNPPGPGASRSGSIDFGGRTRSYRVYIPKSRDAKATAPLVVVLHDANSDGATVAKALRLEAEAERTKTVLVFPDGTGAGAGALNWNDGRKDPAYPPLAGRVDDVGFVAALVDRLQGELTLDPRRIAVVGLGNGGMLAYRLACERAERFAAVGVAGGTMTVEFCAPTRGMALIHVHGSADRTVPVAGGAALGPQQSAPLDTVFQFWRVKNRCRTAPAITTDGGAQRTSFTNCADGGDITTILVDGAGHGWPGRPATYAAGEPPSTFDATTALFEFFRAHPLP